MIKLWKKFIFFKFIKHFFITTTFVLILFSVIDIVTKQNRSEINILTHIYNILDFLPKLLPFITGIAAIKTFSTMSDNNEFLILKSSGISTFKIIKPILVAIFALIFIEIFYFQLIHPKLSKSSISIKENLITKNDSLQYIETPDVLIMYEDFNNNLKMMSNCIATDSSSYIIYADNIIFSKKEILGVDVNLFKIKDNKITYLNSYKESLIPTKTGYETIKKLIIPIKNKALFDLLELKNLKKLSLFLNKILYTLLNILSIIVASSLSFRFSRIKNTFSNYIILSSILILIYTITDAINILNENNIIHPIISFVIITYLIFHYSIKNFIKNL